MPDLFKIIVLVIELTLAYAIISGIMFLGNLDKQPLNQSHASNETGVYAEAAKIQNTPRLAEMAHKEADRILQTGDTKELEAQYQKHQVTLGLFGY